LPGSVHRLHDGGLGSNFPEQSSARAGARATGRIRSARGALGSMSMGSGSGSNSGSATAPGSTPALALGSSSSVPNLAVGNATAAPLQRSGTTAADRRRHTGRPVPTMSTASATAARTASSSDATQALGLGMPPRGGGARAAKTPPAGKVRKGRSFMQPFPQM
jgi:hypothetical protein